MGTETIIAALAIVLALGFDFVNGFHDTANSVATIIYTKSLKPLVAIVMSSILNFCGALLVGTAVAMVITKIIPPQDVTLPMVVSVLMAAVLWNLINWWFTIPISSSHCLIASLFGAGVASAGLNRGNWLGGVNWHELWQVIAALFFSPIIGFISGAVVTYITLRLSGEKEKEKKHRPKLMRWLHIVASGSVSFSHGSNDGQKTMGIVTLILATHFAKYGYTADHVPAWVMAAAATAMALGTISGGSRVIRTVGTKISRERLSQSQGFGASMSTAVIILIASRLGLPISTTHTLSSAVAGGTIPAHGLQKLNANTLRLLATAWILTIPIAATFSAVSYAILRVVWHP